MALGGIVATEPAYRRVSISPQYARHIDWLDLECAGELTEGGDLSKADEFDYTKLVVVAYDKEGKPIHAGGSFKYDVSTYKAKGTWAYEAGVKGKMEYVATSIPAHDNARYRQQNQASTAMKHHKAYSSRT